MEPKDFSLLEQAYKNVYAEGAEEYSGGQHPSKSPNKADRDRYETERRRSEAPKGVGVPDKKTGYGQLKQDVDMFELVKGHLMSEGYADSEKAALAIMSNMSEEWRKSIVEGIFDFLPKSKTAVPGKYGKNTVLAKKNGIEGVADKSKPGSFTPQKGGWDHMDAKRYSREGGDVSLINRRDAPKNRIK